MTIKRPILKSFIAITFAAFVITGCKKKEEPEPTPVVTNTGTTEQSQRAADQSNSDNESNTAMDEANTAMQDVSTTRDFQACGMTIDSSQKLMGKITLNYSGIDCSGTRTRSGSIIIELPYNSTATPQITTWSTAGCKAKLTFVNYKVTYLATNKSLNFNGTHSITNIYGGQFIQRLLAGLPIVYKVRAEMQISYDDGTSRTWKAAKVRAYSQVAGAVKTTIEGDTVINNITNMAMWGTTRLGEEFTLALPTSIAYYIYGSTCLYKPTGLAELRVAAKILTITYGVDMSGTVVTGGCPYGYKLNWTDIQGTPQQYVVAY